MVFQEYRRSLEIILMILANMDWDYLMRVISLLLSIAFGVPSRAVGVGDYWYIKGP